MRVWMYPKKSKENKYNELFSFSLERVGLEVLDFNWGKIFNMKSNDIFHIHWIHGTYQSRNPIISVVKLIITWLILSYLKVRRVRIVWTVHNLYPHEIYSQRLEYLARKSFMLFCNKLFVASNSLKNEVIKEYKINDNKIVVIEHGHYFGAYKESGIDVRKRFNIPMQNYVYMFIGQIRPYKGVMDLIHEYKKLRESNLYEASDSTLLIAGKPTDELRKLIENESRQSENIFSDLRFIPDDEIVAFIKASNAVVLPYKEITTSGTAILAISYKKILIAPQTPFLEEYCTPNTSVLYNQEQKYGLYNSLLKAKKLKIRDEEFEEILSKLDWDNISKKVYKVYRNL